MYITGSEIARTPQHRIALSLSKKIDSHISRILYLLLEHVHECGHVYTGSVTSSDSGHSTMSHCTTSSGEGTIGLSHPYQARCPSPPRHPPPLPGMCISICFLLLDVCMCVREI